MTHDSTSDAAARLERNIGSARELFGRLAELGPEVAWAAEAITAALLAGNKVLACGNGGSAAEAAHLTTEFVVRFVEDRRPYPAICLNTHGGDLTAAANDYGYDEVFARQVGAFGLPGDVLVALSTSGTSENVHRAVEAAKRGGVTVITLLGRDGGPTRGLADVELLVHADVTARIQEAHLLLIHTICELVDERLRSAVSEK